MSRAAQNGKSANPTIYLASSLKNQQLNLKVARILDEMGFGCFLPQRDVAQPENDADSETARKMRDQNIAGLHDADAVLVIALNIGKDTSWEVGFAKALGKRVVMLFFEGDMLQQHPMVWHSADVHLSTTNYADTEEVIKRAREHLLNPEDSMSDLSLKAQDVHNDTPANLVEHKWKLLNVRFKYAWDYFDFHAKQRMTVFNFFMLFAGLLINAYVTVLKDLKESHSPLLATLLALVGAGLTVVFMFLDRRNEELVNVAEDVLGALEYDVLFAGYDRPITWPKRRGWWGGWHKEEGVRRPLGIFRREKEDKNSNVKSRYSHGTWFPRLQWFVIIVFFALALYPPLYLFPWSPFYKPSNPTDKPSNTVIIKTGNANEPN